MKRLCGKLRFFRQDQSGGVLILVAILLVVLMGMAALTVDVGGLYLGRRQAVNAADASALAAALANNRNHAKIAAQEYAEINNDVKFEGIYFTEFADSPGQGNPGQNLSDTVILTVLVSKQVEFSFARVLGFNESDVLAMASVQQGPGNGLVPFGLIGHACYCCDEFAEVDLTTGEYDCGCSPADAVYSEYGCGCKVGYEDTIWKVTSTDGKCLKPGEAMLLRWGEWQANFGPGNHGPVRLPGQIGGVNRFRNDVAGGYEGPLESIAPGEVIDSEPGQFGTPTGHALDDRFKMAGGEYTCTLEDLLASDYPYGCEMVVIVPVVVNISTGPGGGVSVDFEIKGYASFFLEHNMGDDGSEVVGHLIEYLTFDEIKDIFGNRDAEGFVTRLVKDPTKAREELLNDYNSKQ